MRLLALTLLLSAFTPERAHTLSSAMWWQCITSSFVSPTLLTSLTCLEPQRGNAAPCRHSLSLLTMHTKMLLPFHFYSSLRCLGLFNMYISFPLQLKHAACSPSPLNSKIQTQMCAFPLLLWACNHLLLLHCFSFFVRTALESLSTFGACLMATQVLEPPSWPPSFSTASSETV